LLLDQAGWHGAKALKVPSNISILQLPPRAPELKGQENIWQFMRQNWLSNRIFKSFDDIVDHCCYAWNTLIERIIRSQARRFMWGRRCMRPLAKDISCRLRGTCRSGAQSRETPARSISSISSGIKRSCASA